MLSPTILGLFWLHTSYNVHLPHAAYSRTITKLSETAKARKEALKAEGNYDKLGKKEVIFSIQFFRFFILNFQSKNFLRWPNTKQQ